MSLASNVIISRLCNYTYLSHTCNNRKRQKVDKTTPTHMHRVCVSAPICRILQPPLPMIADVCLGATTMRTGIGHGSAAIACAPKPIGSDLIRAAVIIIHCDI
jgi:hypothetical protein